MIIEKSIILSTLFSPDEFYLLQDRKNSVQYKKINRTLKKTQTMVKTVWVSSWANFVDLPDDIKYAVMLTWLNEQVVRKISYENNEPEWMLEHRLLSLKIFLEKPLPTWGPDLSDLDFQKIVFYAKPGSMKQYADSWEDVPQELKDKFERLGIPEAEKKYLAGAGGQMDSEMVYHKIKEKWANLWIIFEDMNRALHTHPEIIKKHFMKLVPPTDHKFAALHGAVWSGGTFIHIPKWIQLTEPLQAYFRMNTESGWQFEHTLIIVEDDAQGNYIEWCSAPKFNKRALHAGCVEIFVGKNSSMRYSSVENWSIDTYNLNTKRAIVESAGHMEWIGGNFWSGKTMLYPMTILKWDYAKAEHLGVALAAKDQVQDTWAKVTHIGKYTSSKIVSKSISKDGGVSTYRGLVDIKKSAIWSVNSTQCDAILVDDISVSNTIPDIRCDNSQSTVAHEASAGKIDEATLLYLMARWIEKDQAAALIVNWFVSPIIKKLPLEYAWELNTLITMEMEWSVG